ncbi:MAG: hypothetical protein U0798_08140 [Gemmataceae bacterium]
MAFNPFNVFRKNQKILFALLTIMVMFMFVLSSGMGKGDFFQFFPEWLGQQRGAGGETVATINGKKLTTGQLSQIGLMRNRVNELMMRLSGVAANNFAKMLDDATTTTADREGAQKDLREFLQIRQAGYLGMRAQQDLMMAQIQGRTIPPMAIMNARFQENMQQMSRFDAIVRNTNAKAEDRDLARSAIALIEIDRNRLFSPTYFATVANKTPNDRFEFELWLKKADKLGIAITPVDAEFMVYGELYGKVGEADWKEAVRELQNKDQRLTTDLIRKGIADEYRVKLAQMAVLGSVDGSNMISADQSVSPPYQMFEFYRQQCDESTYAVLSVPAENYIAKVTGTPTDAELRELFTKNRTREPNPVLEQPGFKEPRKLKLEWLQAKGDEAFYKAASKDALAKAEVQAKLSGLMCAPIVSTSAISVVSSAALLNLKTDDLLKSVYENYKTSAEFNIRANWDFNFLPTRADVTDASLAKPANLAALTASAAGSLLAHGSPLTPAIMLAEKARMEERNAKARAQMSAFVVPVIGSVPIGSALAVAYRIPAPLPLAVLREDSEKKIRERLARQLCFNDLTKFQTEVASKGKGIDKAGARDYITNFLNERKFEHGESKAFHDQYTMFNDPGLKPLTDLYTKLAPKSQGSIFFGSMFFVEQDMRGQVRSATSMYAPSAYPPNSLNEQTFVGSQMSEAPTEPAILTWRIAEEQALEPKSMDDPKVKEKVVDAWKRIKAREMAKAKADELAKQASTFGTNEAVIRGKMIDIQAELKAGRTDKEALERVKYFEIPKVSYMVTSGPSLSVQNRQSVQPFQYLPNENCMYPTAEMTSELLKNRDKPVGSAIVLGDMPKDTYYVAVVANKVDRIPFEFAKGIYSTFTMSQNPNELDGYIRSQFQMESAQKSRLNAINLIKAELKVENENAKALSEKGDSNE